VHLQKVVEPFVPQSRDLFGRERGPLDEFVEQFERGPQTRGRDLDAGRESVPAGVGVERGAEPLGCLDQFQAGVARRAFGHRSRCQNGDPGPICRLVRGPDPEDQVGRHERPTRHVDGQDLESGRQHSPLETGEVIGARLAGRRSGGQDLLECHAAGSSSSPWVAGAASGM
jgi:hypothetical protein